jgi:hypothetical protein
MESLRTIHSNQAHYSALKGKFGSLKELSEAGLVDANYGNGAAVSGYIYNSTEATADQYCVQATRQSPSTAYKDFNVIEDGTIRYLESKTPNPLPHGEGSPIGSAPGAAAPAAGQQPQQ